VTSPLRLSGHAASAPPSARALLRDVFGFAEYRPAQKEIVDHLVAGSW
jgi:superfamily II DNA helicase RecQ